MRFRSFILQAPLALLCCIACVVLLSSGQHIEESCENTDQTDQKPRKVDYLGIGTFTIMITSFFAVIELFGRAKLDITISLIFIGVALSFGLLFLLIEAYLAKEPLIPLTLLKTVLGIHFLIQILLLLGRQSVCHLPCSSFFKNIREDTDGVHSTCQASPHIFFRLKISIQQLLHYTLFRRRSGLPLDLSLLATSFKGMPSLPSLGD